MSNDLIEWQEWDIDLFKENRYSDKPIFLWVANRGCEWCNRMQNESFSDPDIAEYLNSNFIPVKIDSYQRPDIAKYCQNIYGKMTGRKSGYPLSIFLSTEKIPLYSTGYIPNLQRDGMMGMGELAELICSKYRDEKDLLIKKGEEILKGLNEQKEKITATKIDIGSLLLLISDQIGILYDRKNGGFGDYPKFPRTSAVHLAMDIYEQNGDRETGQIIKSTLDSLIRKSLLDTQEGGFWSYCSDSEWKKPYKIKTVYDNALLIELLLRAYRLFGKKSYLSAATDTLEFVCSRFMREGLFDLLYENGYTKDDQNITSYNAMMIKSLLLAGEHDPYYRQLAITVLSDLMEQNMSEGVLYRQRYSGHKRQTKAFLEDYAYLSDTLIAAYETTSQEHYLIKASEIINEALRRFFNGGLWLCSEEEFEVLATVADEGYPSALSMIATSLQKVTKLISPEYQKFLYRTIEVNSYELMRQPISMPQFTRAAMATHLSRQ